MAYPINYFTACPEDCDEVVLMPAIPVNQDCTSYKRYRSQLGDLIIRWTGATDPFAAFATTPTYVADSIDNTNADNTKSKRLAVVGSVGVPSSTDIPYPKFLNKKDDKTFEGRFDVYQLDDGTYSMLQLLDCGATNFTFYYTDEHWVYGIQGGIKPTSVSVEYPQASGDGLAVATIIITWKADTIPDRRINPLT